MTSNIQMLFHRLIAFMLLGAPLLLVDVGLVAANKLGNEIATLNHGERLSSDRIYRQDFCELYKMMENNERNISNVLSGQELMVSLKAEGSYFNYDPQTGIDPDYPGVEARMLDEIAKRGNFTWRNSFGVWTKEEKGSQTYTEFIQREVLRFDMLVGTYTPSAERMELGISFVDGHFDGSFIMVTNAKDTSSIEWTNYMSPFHIHVWFLILAVILLSAIAYQTIEHLEAKSDDKSFQTRSLDNLYLSFINFTGNYSYDPFTAGGRVFGFVTAFWATLITAAYTANLASLLVVKANESQLRDIQDAIDGRLKICVHRTSYANEWMVENYPASIPYLVPVPRDLMTQSLNEGKCDVLIHYKQEFESEIHREENNPSCTLQWEGRAVKTFQDGFATKLDPGIKCTDLVNEVFDYYNKVLGDERIFDEIWNEHNAFHGTDGHCGLVIEGDDDDEGDEDNSDGSDKGSDNGSDNDGSLSAADMAGVMAFQVAGSVVAIIISAISAFRRKKGRKPSVTRTSIGSTSSNPMKSELVDLAVHMNRLTKMTSVLAEMSATMNDKLERMQKQMECTEGQSGDCFQSQNRIEEAGTTGVVDNGELAEPIFVDN